jgi:hypothetical protein
LEDVGHGGGKMAGVEVIVISRTETRIKGMKNDVKKERRASRERRLHDVKFGTEHKSTEKVNLRS